MLRTIIYYSIKSFARLVCGVKVIGKEHMPSKGPFLIVINHTSAIDPPLSVHMTPKKLRLTGVAAMSHRNDFFVGWLMDKAEMVWVRRGEPDRQALRQMLDVLDKGRVLGLAPEGTRSRSGKLVRAKTGVAFVAIRAGVPILPMAIEDAQKAFPALRRLRRATVTATFGPPFVLPSRGEYSRREHLNYCTDLIMARLACMLPLGYHGYYTDHPLIAYWKQLDATGQSGEPGWFMPSESAQGQD